MCLDFEPQRHRGHRGHEEDARGSGGSGGGCFLQGFGDDLLDGQRLAFGPGGGKLGFIELGARGGHGAVNNVALVGPPGMVGRCQEGQLGLLHAIMLARCRWSSLGAGRSSTCHDRQPNAIRVVGRRPRRFWSQTNELYSDENQMDNVCPWASARPSPE
jgi:hypothetical protein